MNGCLTIDPPKGFEMRLLFLTIIGLICGVGCDQPKAVTRPVTPELTKLYGGDAAIAAILNANSVQAYRLPAPSEHRQLLADYKMAAGPIAVSQPLAARIRDVLLDHSVYVWDAAKGCGDPDYGVRIQFLSGSDEVNVLLCFHCDMLGVYHNGKNVDIEDFDYGREKLVAIVKEIFPEDKVIQSLKPSRRP